MQSEGTADVVRRAYEAFNARDREAFEGLMADGFSFTSPYDDHIGKAAYMERCWPNGERFESFTTVRLVAEGPEAFILYEVATKDGKRFRNTEFLTVEGGRLKAVEVFFGDK